MNVGGTLRVGEARGELERQAREHGMTAVDYLTKLLEDAKIPTLTLQQMVHGSNFSRGELGWLLGVSVATVAKWKSGAITKCRAGTRDMIRKKLNIEITFLR